MHNCIKKLCILSGNFRTWMIDVLPQIINTIKETYNLQSYDTEIAMNTKALFGQDFSSLSFHHSVFITHHPSPITHHSSLKISQFSLPCIWTLFSLQITQIFHHFLWDPQLITKSVIAIVYPRNNSQFLQFSFPFHPENRVPFPTQT